MSVHIDVMPLDMLLWILGGFGDADYSRVLRAKWTDEECAALKQLWDDRTAKPAVLEKRFGRDRYAIYEQAKRMGLPLRYGRRPRTPRNAMVAA